MSIMDELKKLTRPYDDDDALIDEDSDLDAEVEEPVYARPTAAPAQPAQPVQPVTPVPDPINMGGGASAPVNPGYGVPDPGYSATPINMAVSADTSKYRVVLVKPEEFDAATAIAKHICQGDTVILNCEETNEQVARRVIDFLSGCAFALDGSIKKASSSVIIIAPRNVGVDDARDTAKLGE